MKFHPIAAIAVIALAVAACHDEAPTPPDDTVTVPDETTPPPRPDRDPCGKTKDGTACP